VGLLGFVVQLACVAILVRAGVHYLVATAAAVETAVLHNFLWHERWTWRDRRSEGPVACLTRLTRFHVLNGGISLVGNLVLTALFVRAFGMHPLLANASAVAACSLLNFLASDRLVFSRPAGAVLVALALVVPVSSAEASGPSPDTESAWRAYEARVDARHRAASATGTFFVQEQGSGTDWLARVRRGETVIRQAGHGPQAVPDARVHHWAGAVFVPGVTLDELLARLHDQAGRESDLYDDVLESRLLDHDPDRFRIFMRIRRESVLTLTYDTEHEVRYRRFGDRATGTSVATRIAEVADAGTPRERVLAPGQDRGFLWRLNAYWRYEQVPGGVLVECESLTLSRQVPSLVRAVVSPLVDRVARESLERTLLAVRAALARHGS
jgi:putative flippase GtrA